MQNSPLPLEEGEEPALPAARLALPVQRWRRVVPAMPGSGSLATSEGADHSAWQCQDIDDWVAEEVPVALEFNGIAYATMLASPSDLEDFARGFALTEGLVTHAGEIYGIEVLPACDGIVIQVEIATARAVALRERRRALAGRTGCGLCGVESLPEVRRQVAPVQPPAAISLEVVMAVQQAMLQQQNLYRRTGATHAAGLARADGTLLCVREDVGRHNALDKLIGATMPGRPRLKHEGSGGNGYWKLGGNGKQGGDGPESTAGPIEAAVPGLVIVSSRASFEMVQKTLAAGHYLLAAVSAPTAMAVRLAQEHGLILLGFVRSGQATVYAGQGLVQP